MNNMKLFKLKGHERPITNIMYDTSSKYILSSSKDGSMVIWDENYEILQKIQCSGSIYDTGLNKEYIYTGSTDGIMTLWDYECNKIKTYSNDGPIKSINYNEDKELYFILSKKLTKVQSNLTLLNKDLQKLSEIVFDIQYNKAILFNDKIICGGTDGTLQTFSYDNNQLLLLTSISVHKSEITDIKIDYKKNILVTSSYDKNVKIFNLNTFEHIATYNHCVSVSSISIHPELNIIALGGGLDKMDVANSKDNNGFYIVFIDSINADKILQFDSKHFGPINTLCFNHLNNAFVSGGEDGYVHLWECKNDWINNETIEYNNSELIDNKKILEECKILYNKLEGKNNKNQRRNLRKKIDKLELLLNDGKTPK